MRPAFLQRRVRFTEEFKKHFCERREAGIPVRQIRRLMKKFGLVCPTRGANPYRMMAAVLKNSQVAPNVVNRDFASRGSRKILLTDIAYLFYMNGCFYLATSLDAVTDEVLASPRCR